MFAWFEFWVCDVVDLVWALVLSAFGLILWLVWVMVLSTGGFGGCFVVIGLVWVVWFILWVVFWMVWPNIGFGCSGYLVRGFLSWCCGCGWLVCDCSLWCSSWVGVDSIRWVLRGS